MPVKPEKEETPVKPEKEEYSVDLESIVKDVYKEMARLQKEFEQTFRDIWSKLPKIPVPISFGFFEPAYDIEDKENEIVLYVDLPGFTRDEIKIRVTEDSVEIRAEKSESRKLEEKSKNYVVKQRVYEGFYKRIVLPVKVKPEEARAKLVNGVLELILPKSEAKKEVEISVE